MNNYGTLDALARVDMLSGDPALDRRLSALAQADPLGLRVPRSRAPGEGMIAIRDDASPERHAWRLPVWIDFPPAGDDDHG
jgi:hypothetical protein